MAAQTAVPFLNAPFLYFTGFQLSNTSGSTNSSITAQVGNCRDSSNIYQIITTTALTCVNTTTGIGALDTGTVAASTTYTVYVVADAVDGNPAGLMISTSLTGPLMPFGYNVWRHIGYVSTDASSHFLIGSWVGNENTRKFYYDAPQATAVTAGAATTFTGVSLAKWVPAIAAMPVFINTSYVPATAGNALSLQPSGGTGTAILVTGQVETVPVTTNSILVEQLSTGIPEINYKVGNASDTVAINVAGYEFYV